MKKLSETYLDYNSTCPMIPEVVDGMAKIMSQPLNSSSIHKYGRHAKMVLERARDNILSKLGADEKYQLIFTSSGTESNNIALCGFPSIPVICTTIEHPSVLHVLGEGLVPVDRSGIVKLDDLEKLLSAAQKPCLVSIILANNEVGVIQPMKEIVNLTRKYNCLIHSDATQAFGKIPLDVADLDLDLVTISSHKIGGPQGAAALVYKKNLGIKPLMLGGGQEFRIRPGTQNIAAIHGFSIASDMIDVEKYSKINVLRDHLEKEISKIYPDITIFSKDANRLPNTSSFSMPGVRSETQLIHFDTKGFAISAGSACSSGRIDLPITQMGMGYSEDVARCAIRLSLGTKTTNDDITAFVKSWRDLYKKTSVKLMI